MIFSKTLPSTKTNMKIAVFVEGLTELEFVWSLVKAVCGQRGIDLEVREQSHGRLVFVSLNRVPEPSAYLLIVNCKSDGQVKTQIRDQYTSLVAADYTHIIGLRDVFPFAHADIPKLKSALAVGLPAGGPVGVEMHLAILEVESWFLDEITHFERIDPALTHAFLVAGGFDVIATPGEAWGNPAETLDNIYKLCGKRYRKKLRFIQRTVNSLSPEELYVNVRSRAPSFDEFLGSLERALF